VNRSAVDCSPSIRCTPCCVARERRVGGIHPPRPDHPYRKTRIRTVVGAISWPGRALSPLAVWLFPMGRHLVDMTAEQYEQIAVLDEGPVIAAAAAAHDGAVNRIPRPQRHRHRRPDPSSRLRGRARGTGPRRHRHRLPLRPHRLQPRAHREPGAVPRQLQALGTDPLPSTRGALPLAVALSARGYPDETITGILGGNFLRVAHQVWNPATGAAIEPSSDHGAAGKRAP
jgi:hypothetical protein